MSEIQALEVLLYRERIATITRLAGDRTIFAFDQEYVDREDRPTLSLSFKDELGGLVTNFNPTTSRLVPFFSNLLPEGPMRTYLANRAQVNPAREFFLLWALGRDLPGAVSVQSIDGHALPEPDPEVQSDSDGRDEAAVLRFSLAGMQLKFSAVLEASGGLALPVSSVGGDWILKLPSTQYSHVPENEYAMMRMASQLGMTVPDLRLVNLSEVSGLPADVQHLEGKALAIRRFDRASTGDAIHTEDFAQVFDVYPGEKYKRASFKNIAEVLWAEDGEGSIAEFIRRFVFNALIGNGDMHLKNWSLIYRDPRHPELAPAYDFVSTVAYLPGDKLALNFLRSKRFQDLTVASLSRFAARARLPAKLVLDVAMETVEGFHAAWQNSGVKSALPTDHVAAIEAHVASIPLAQGR